MSPIDKMQIALAAARRKDSTVCTASELADRQAREYPCAGKPCEQQEMKKPACLDWRLTQRAKEKR